MSEEKDILILAIESSCDETAAAVVKNGRTVLSNVISSQIELHKLYGGVVPEIASRKHIEKINQVIGEALSDAGVTLDDLDAVGVTYGPGLVGALLVGRIVNHPVTGTVCRGQEKGYFQFGGSTIVLLLQKHVSLPQEFFHNTAQGWETRIYWGESLLD